MKKFLSFVLALFMLALPVLSGAEEAAAADSPEDAFALKYLRDGQQQVVNLSVKPGIYLMTRLQKKFRDKTAAIQDLCSVLQLEAASQSSETGTQGSLRLLIGGENVANLTVARADSGYYLKSNFLGGSAVRFTPEQLEARLDQLMQQMGEQGTVPQNQMNSLQSSLSAFLQNPEGTITSIDSASLLKTFQDLITVGEMEELAEVPEGVPIDAKYVTHAVITKEAVKKAADGISGIIEAIPFKEQILAYAGHGESRPEVSLVKEVKLLSDSLAEDIQATVYANEGQDVFFLISDIILTEGKVNLTGQLEKAAEKVHAAWTVRMQAEEAEVELVGDHEMTATENGRVMTYDLTANVNRNGESYEAEKLLANITWMNQGNTRQLNADFNARIRQNAVGETVKLLITLQGEEKDLGDHAEENAKLTMSIGKAEQWYEAFSMNLDGRTVPAEAYITSGDVLDPLAMDEGEQRLFKWGVLVNAIAAVGKLVSKVPESVQPLIREIEQDLISRMMQ